MCNTSKRKIDVLSDGAANMKKLFLSILLLCCCIVFTGCGGNSNSYDGAYRIIVPRKIIDENLNVSGRASVSVAMDIKLCLNGVEFPGQSFDSDGDYIFTKVMFEQEANQIISFRNTSLIELFDGSSDIPFATIEFERVAPLPQSIIITRIDATHVSMAGSNGSINAYYYIIPSGRYPQDGLEKVETVLIEEVDSLTARVTFKNCEGEGVDIGVYDSWTISGKDITDNTKSASYTYYENEHEKRYFLVEKYNTGVYIIRLTSDGETKATLGNHTLDNTEITINEIKNGDKYVVEPSILQKAVYRPSTK